MSGITIRLARLGDEMALQDFLVRHADSSLYLRYFIDKGGLVDDGKQLQGTYAAAFLGRDVVGVAMHNWQGGVFLQAPAHAAELSNAVVKASKRALIALLGPYSQVEEAHLGLGERPASKRAKEGLFALSIGEMICLDHVSPSLACRLARSEDLALLLDWRFRYEMEATGLPDTDSTREFAKSAIEGHVAREEAFLLEADGKPVSLCTRTARAFESIQIGGVWTPPELRNRGYGRAVVAGALREAAQGGVTRAVLFTDNPAARRSYEALGFRQVGDYGITIYPP
ncbi:GNAT family N-acetyltransferase [Mesorhizobium sp. B1-1-5]|uniref:GNAT family N-acetyltransferase n=1 Tax=Mesorhizobium sp. B1-1-5 TaxID=2589979 RepID=UPI00112B4E71|nr:GNAT family N-acetyltransferase [Mesorhizobium sp. B1-1-5]TPO05147.1 GNAT family N-acetyltransferase [Mesorhizobium sp. B1-1-5]